jgi:hypothetical protein
MRSKALPRPQNRNGDSHRRQCLPQPTTTPTAKKGPCQKGTHCRRSTPHLHVLPHGGRNTEGPPQDQGGLRRRPTVLVQTPTMEAPNTAASKGPCTHRQRDDTKAHQRSKHSAMERHHHHHRLTSYLHREGYQICLLNDQKSAYSKEERDSTTTDVGMANQRRDHAPNLVGRQRRSDLTTVAKQHRLDQL